MNAAQLHDYRTYRGWGWPAHLALATARFDICF